MHDPIQNLIAQQEFIVLDGAMATELERRGADLADPLWSAKCLLERPELIRAVHLDYLQAGADIATTATYQATFEAFERRGISREAAANIIRHAVALAISARDEFWSAQANRAGRQRPLVAASIGPYGAMLADGSEYRGHYAVDDQGLADFHRPRLRLLADSGADLLAFETIPCLREAIVLAHLLKEFPALTAWTSFSCSNGQLNSEGEDVARCVEALNHFPQITAVGINCTAPQHITPLLRRMRARTAKPLVVYPNSGESYDASSKQWCGNPGTMALGVHARIWYGEGAKLIGGCCRTGPADIRGVTRCLSLD